MSEAVDTKDVELEDARVESSETVSEAVDTVRDNGLSGAAHGPGVSVSSSPVRGEGLDKGIDKLESRRDEKEERRAAGELSGQKARGWTEKLLTRTTSGAIYSIIIIGCLFLGRMPTTIVIAAMAWLCCSEFFHMSRMAGRMPNEIIGLSVAVAYPLATLLRMMDNPTLSVTAVLLLCCAVWYVLTPRANIADVAITAFGPIYTSLPFGLFAVIRSYDKGLPGALLALAVIGSIWLNDAGAYLIGSRFGVHRLAPRISPKKSIEGFWGGLVCSLIPWLILYFIHVTPIDLPWALLCAVVVGVTSVVGDLFESRIKRGVGVKDSGNIMPGHGGLLDRSDALLFGSTMAYLILHLGGIL